VIDGWMDLCMFYAEINAHEVVYGTRLSRHLARFEILLITIILYPVVFVVRTFVFNFTNFAC